MQNERPKLPPLGQRPQGPSGPGGGSGGGFPALPKDYLKGGYFTPEGHPRTELVADVANKVAEVFLIARPQLTTGQMRAFFQTVRSIEYRLKTVKEPFAAVEQDLQALWSKAAERKEKEKVPPEFVRFIKANLDLVTDQESFLKGFLPHLQAVVAFHYRKGA
jgi:CRISPR type III-A-associated protein Csm2